MAMDIARGSNDMDAESVALLAGLVSAIAAAVGVSYWCGMFSRGVRPVCKLLKLVRRVVGAILNFLLVNEYTAWSGRQGFFLICYAFYGLGSVFAEDSGHPWHSVVQWYALAAGLAWVILTTWVAYWKRKFQRSLKRGRGGAGASALQSFVGVSIVLFVTLAAQMFLMGFAHRPDHSTILWVVSFGVITSAVAGLGAYFFIGYPGMADLELVDRRLSRQQHSATLAGDAPEALVVGLKAEMDMLRTIMRGIVYLNVVVTASIILGLDKVALLFDQETFGEVPLAAKLWFISGAALLFFACHASITGPVHGRYYDIARRLREMGTAAWRGVRRRSASTWYASRRWLG